MTKFAVFGVVAVGADRESFRGVRGVSGRLDERLLRRFHRRVQPRRAVTRSASRAFGSAPSTGDATFDDNTVLVSFDADDDVVLTTGTRAAVRYLNLVGDRYLELVDGPDRPG